MTENEAKAKLERTSVLWESATNTEMVEAVKMAIKALEEIQQYRALGTIEEIKDLKEKERKCEECAGCTEWLCDCANVREKAIDEFAEKLKDLIAKNVEDAESSNDLCCEIFQSEIDEIAEQMKGGE